MAWQGTSGLSESTEPEGRPADDGRRARNEALLVRNALDDPEAFRVIHGAHARGVAEYLYRRTGDLDLAEELAARTMAAAWAGLARYRVGSTPLRCWLLRIALNELRGHLRRDRRRAAAMRRWAARHAPAQEPAVSPTGDGRADAEAALRALRALPDTYSEALSLFHLADLSVEDVAATMRRPVGTVKSLLSRGRERLRAELAGLDATDQKGRTRP